MGLGGDAVDGLRDDHRDEAMPYGVDTIRLRISFPDAPVSQGYNGRMWRMRPLRGWTGAARLNAQRAEGEGDVPRLESEAFAPSTLLHSDSHTTETQRDQTSGDDVVQKIQFAPGRMRPVPVPLPPVAIPGTVENEGFVRSAEDFIRSTEDLAKSAARRLEDALKAIDKALHAQKADEPPKPKGPEKISPSSEATTPTGPEDPDGDSTQPSQQDPAKQGNSQLTNNRVRV